MAYLKTKTFWVCGLFGLSLVVTAFISSHLALVSETRVDEGAEGIAATEKSEEIGLIWPDTIALPRRYFEREDFPRQWSNSEEVAVDDGARSAPTSTVTYASFKNRDSSLPPLPERLEQIYEEDAAFSTTLRKERDLYGELAVRYNASGKSISEVRSIDVTGDEIPEKLVFWCGTGGNHCPHGVDVIRGDTIIFSAWPATSFIEIEPSKSGSGFYVQTTPAEMLPGLCCPSGYLRIRFVYESGNFLPIYQQDVRLLKAKGQIEVH